MLAALRHRGPDDEGIWREDGVWFGHRRLSILDVSPAGHQPMVSACGRWVLSINGEIYNYVTLRQDVEATGAVAWRGRSDSEVFLEAVARLGLGETLRRARGMFAFGLWDRERRTAYLGRDPFGEKPLYYSATDRGLTFGSELTAIECAPDLDTSLDADGLSLFFRYGYIPAPFTPYLAARKLPPGSVLIWRPGGPATVEPYFSVSGLVEAGQADRLVDPDQAVDALEALLRDAVGDQMVADVPLGAFLSGGVDSSLVVAIMQSLAARPVKTFTLGFDVPAFNEAEYALAVARRLRTDHTEHYVSGADARDIVPDLGRLFDEPFADASQLPTVLISRMARRHVTVCLTGDGGDEMFAGYVRYPGVPRLWNAVGAIPFRGVAARLLKAAPMALLERGLAVLGPVARQYASRGKLAPSLRKAAGWLDARSREDLYELTMTAWPSPDNLLVRPGAGVRQSRPPPPDFDSPLCAMLWRDTVDYLPGDILCKVDRAAMASALETRVPLLDPRIAAFSWRAPDSLKIRGGETKWLLRRVLDRYVPRALIDRPKMGFSVPLHDWLTGALRDWAEALLDPAVIRRQGVLQPAPIASAWRRYLSGDSSFDHQIWTVLMFQSWMAARGR